MNTEDHYLKSELYSLVQKDLYIFEFLQEGSLDGIWYWDLENPEIEWMSPRFWETLGYDYKDMKPLASEWQDLIHPDDLQTAIINFNKHCEDPSHPYDQVVRYRHKDGSTVWVRCRGIAVRDDAGKPIRMLGAHTDLTPLKRTEEQLLKSEARLKEAQTLAKIGSWDFDIINNDLYWSDEVYRIFDLKPQQFQAIYEAFLENIHPEDRDFVNRAYTESVKNKTPYDIVHRLLLADGTVKYVNERCATFYDEMGRAYRSIGTVQDITERKAAETQRKELEEQLSQKCKMEAIGLMAGGIAHNFNNNLAIILGNMDLAKLKLAQNSEVHEFIDDARKAVLRSRELIQQILTYSRKGSYEKTSLQISLLVDETLKLLRSTIPTTVEFKYHVEPEEQSATIQGDASRIQETLLNLCNNAVHAMEEDGQITIVLETLTLQRENIPSQYNCLPGDYVRVSVQDTGCGMTTETLQKIFDPFFTTKSINEGTGMGLATVRGVVEQHHGFIKVRSTLGKGTTFELYFPLSALLPDDTATSNGETPHGTEKILFVDDDEMLATLGGTMLSEMGYMATTETSSRSALQIIKDDPAQFDLVITDQTMPDLDGKGLSLALHQIRPDLPIILCTGYSNKISEEEAKRLGFDAFLMKPIEMSTLSKTVRRVLDKKFNCMQKQGKS